VPTPSASLRLRLSLASAVVLAVFLALTAAVLDRGFQQAARLALQEQLQARVYTLLAAAELAADGRLLLPEHLPEPRLSSPGSGLYARVVGADAEVQWRSQSLSWRSLPPVVMVAPAASEFDWLGDTDPEPLFVLRFGIEWEDDEGGLWPFTLELFEHDVGYRAQLSRFRRTLAWGLGAVVVAMLLVQALVLAWGLRPLRGIGAELEAIESGRQTHLQGRYPLEIAPLTSNINRFIDQQQVHRDRYRDSLADLAHSLKTPLAVLGAALDADSADAQAQLQRMADIVNYQLGRAATAGRSPLTAPVAIRPLVASLCASLQKVHVDRGLHCSLSIPEDARFAGDQGDLMEMLGNLLENAWKWARQRVECGAEGGGDVSLRLWVEDDGPGVAAGDRQRILRRGQYRPHPDGEVSGHGIGLAVVQDIVSAYRGGLSLHRSADAGQC